MIPQYGNVTEMVSRIMVKTFSLMTVKCNSLSVWIVWPVDVFANNGLKLDYLIFNVFFFSKDEFCCFLFELNNGGDGIGKVSS